jgi:hypothetical protein
MANENKSIVVDFTLKTDGTEKGLKNVEEGLTEIENSLKDIGKGGGTQGLEQQLQKLNKVIDTQNLTWGEVGRSIEQYQNIALAAGKESPIGKEAIKRAGDLKREADTLTKSIDQLALKGQTLQGALQLGATVTAGYGALQGVMALAGQENEKLMQSLVKMQAAQSVLGGIEQVRIALQKESAIMTTFQTAQTKIATAAQSAYAFVVGTSTGALKLFKLALVATGIGAIIVGIGLLIANFESVVKWVKEASDTIYKIFKPQIDIVIKALQFLGLVDDDNTKKLRSNNQKKIKSLEAERDAFVNAKKDEIKALDERYENESSAMQHQLALAQANGEDTVKLERALLEEKKRVTAEKIALLEELVRKEFESNLAIIRINAQTNDFVAGMLSTIEKDMQSKGGQEAYINQLIGNDKSLNELKKTLDTTTKELEIFEVKVAKAKRDAASKEIDWRKGIDEEIIQGEMRKAEAIKTITTGLQQFNLEAYQKELDEKAAMQKKQDEDELARKLALADKTNQFAQDGFDFLGNLNSSPFFRH